MSTSVTKAPLQPRLSFSGVIASESLKLFSLRSTYWVLGVFIVITVGISALVAMAVRASPIDDADLLSTLHLSVIISSGIILFGNLVIGILGVLTVTNEYSSGMIRSTLAAVPRRFPAVMAKVVVLTLVSFVCSSIATLFSYLVGRAIFGDLGADVGLSGQNGRIILGIQLYVVVMALLGCMIGLLIRSTAGSIATLIALTLVLPSLGGILRPFINIDTMLGAEVSGWRRLLLYFFDILPTNAGGQILSWVEESATTNTAVSLNLSPWAGYAVFCLWVVAFAIPALWRLKARDA
jgi:ABC-2 type transport system permease protein